MGSPLMGWPMLKIYFHYRVLLFLTLSLGFFLVHHEQPVNMILDSFISGLAFVFQNFLVGSAFLGSDRQQSEFGGDRDFVFYRGEKQYTFDREKEEHSYLGWITGFKHVLSVRVCYCLLICIYILLAVFGKSFALSSAGLWGLLSSLFVASSASLGHFLIPIFINFMSVLFVVSKSSQISLGLALIYLGAMTIVLYAHKLTARWVHFQESRVSDLPEIVFDRIGVFARALALISLFIFISNSIIPDSQREENEKATLVQMQKLNSAVGRVTRQLANQVSRDDVDLETMSNQTVSKNISRPQHDLDQKGDIKDFNKDFINARDEKNEEGNEGDPKGPTKDIANQNKGKNNSKLPGDLTLPKIPSVELKADLENLTQKKSEILPGGGDGQLPEGTIKDEDDLEKEYHRLSKLAPKDAAHAIHLVDNLVSPYPSLTLPATDDVPQNLGIALPSIPENQVNSQFVGISQAPKQQELIQMASQNAKTALPRSEHSASVDDRNREVASDLVAKNVEGPGSTSPGLVKQESLAKWLELLKRFVALLVAGVLVVILLNFFKTKNVHDVQENFEITDDQKKLLKSKYQNIEHQKLSARELVISYYEVFLQSMGLVGWPKEDYFPPTDYSLFLGRRFHRLKSEFKTITDIYCETLFSSTQISRPQVDKMRQHLESILRFVGAK